jgi:glutathione synthase/RimK-type ligase-like ATP-grasp enzyme
MSRTLVVVENHKRWNMHIPGTEVIGARDYLTNPQYAELKRAKVFNLCKTYRYQSLGYYVSLLAAARGHRALPSVNTIQDLREVSLVKLTSQELEGLIDRSLESLKSEDFELSIYFGRNIAARYDRLSQSLFNHFPSPLLRAEFHKHKNHWRLTKLRPIASSDIPDAHREFVCSQAESYFSRKKPAASYRPRYDLAILLDEEAQDSPSDGKAITRFIAAAKELGIDAQIISKDDFGQLAEYDALFIRVTTAVNHYTYRFATRAEAEGLVVIDDPQSIIRCSNKVYLADLFGRHGLPIPKTFIVHKDNRDQVAQVLGLPCVLKRPDSAFSMGVVRASTAEDLHRVLDEFLEDSDLVVAQSFVPTGYDWRIGVLDGKPLYACKYHMAQGHWQIRKTGESGPKYGKVETMPIGAAPPRAIELAVKASRLIGRGLYGVDLKEVDGQFLIIEVNDNPNIDAGVEDAVLKEDLYREIMRAFYERLEDRGKSPIP